MSGFVEAVNTMREKSIELGIRLAKLKDENDELLHKSKKILTSVKELVGNTRAPVLCSICLEKNVDACLTPCGHCACIECIDKAKQNHNIHRCLFCRTRVVDVVRIYI